MACVGPCESAASLPRWRSQFGVAVGLAVLVPGAALAHAVVYPKTSPRAAYEKYVLRVPSEKGVPTTRVEIRFSADVRVVSFAGVSGWQLQVLSDSAGRVRGAASRETFPVRRFVEFPFVAVNPSNEVRLAWPGYQTYAEGKRVEWTLQEQSDRPASSTIVRPARDRRGSGWAFCLSAAALVLALIGLGLALRPRAGQ